MRWVQDYRNIFSSDSALLAQVYNLTYHRAIDTPEAKAIY
jgi:hypothetical protein